MRILQSEQSVKKSQVESADFITKIDSGRYVHKPSL